MALAFSQVQEVEDLLPHGQAAPVTGWFSVAERSQVHSPAGRALQEHRAPLTVFSVEALLQVQWRAFCLPQEHLAWAAQTQLPSPEVLQQVEEGWTILTG
jgi:hypothetical protein